jgi:hypothetical protein
MAFLHRELPRGRNVRSGQRWQGSVRTALESGAIPGHHERYRWVLTSEDVDAAESYFREIAIIGANKGGAAAVRQAKVRQRASETP